MVTPKYENTKCSPWGPQEVMGSTPRYPRVQKEVFNYRLDEVNHKHVQNIESWLPYQSLLAK